MSGCIRSRSVATTLLHVGSQDLDGHHPTIEEVGQCTTAMGGRPDGVRSKSA